MAIKYIPYMKEPVEGQAILNNFTRTRRLIKYSYNDEVFDRIEKGMPLYEVELSETVGDKNTNNMVIRGECVSACAFLKDQGIKVDLVYIDPPFASGADYAKKVYIRKNPKIADEIKKKEEELSNEDLKSFEEKMYGDMWTKEAYLNWLYENLTAIKTVMSENAAIFLHLDHHIGHYAKILMDEIFGENNFRNEIIWSYRSGGASKKESLGKKHDVIYFYSNSADFEINSYKERQYLDKSFMDSKQDEEGRYYSDTLLRDVFEGVINLVEGDEINEYNVRPVLNLSKERLDYNTQKPEGLLKLLLKVASKEGMVVADFFGGSGVTAKTANDLGRNFIHCDIGINSLETTRDRLVSADASFKVLDIKDGVNLYRNPVQTMEKVKTMIHGLKEEKRLSDFWAGVINDSKNGLIPVYIPNLVDSTTRLLDVVMINKIINEAIPELDDDIKKVIIYYIDISDEKEIKDYIKNYLKRDIEIELRDLKEVLSETVVSDVIEFHLENKKVVIDKIISDRLIEKINEHNEKMHAQEISGKEEVEYIDISDDGLELIEWISLDSTSKNGIWNSDKEIKIDKYGYLIEDGESTKTFWDGSVSYRRKPKRIKVRNIAGDETVLNVE